MLAAELDAPPRLLASPSVRLIRLGDRAALFCERRQQLFELNASAEAIWRGLADGQPIPPELAPFVDEAAKAWLAAGLLAPVGRSGRERHLRIADTAFVLAAPEAFWPDLDAAFGQFAAGPAPGVRIDILADEAGWCVLEDGASRGLFPRERVVPEVKAVLTDRLSQAVGGGAFLIHAALLAHEGRGLLITGRPGAGKTTLTLALAARGLGYASDDVVRVSADGRFEGVPFGPAAKSGAWPLIAPHVPAVLTEPTHLRGDGQQVRYVPTTGFGPGRVDRLGWALLLDRREACAVALEPLDPMAVLTELLASAHAADRRLSGDSLAAFARGLAHIDGRRLVYSDLGEAVAAIEALVRG